MSSELAAATDAAPPLRPVSRESCPLCGRDGEVLYRDESGGFSSGGGSSFSAAGNARDRGQWSVQGSQLQMRWGDGSTTTLQLSRDGEKTLVNGTRYFLVDSERCD